jgi:Dockerin type I domain
MFIQRRRLRLERLESRVTPAMPAAAPSLGAPPPPSANVIWVNTVGQLQNAVQNLQSDQTIVVQPGTYQINVPLYVGLAHQVSNVMIRGSTDNFNDVVIRGAGMDNNAVTYGFGFFNAQDVTVANLSVGAVYFDAIDLKGDAGAARIHLYHDRLFDTGEQIIKSNPGPSGGANDCTVEYCLVEYTNGPSTIDHGGGTGYTNGISAHTVNGWQIRNNLFRNFHTPDSVANLWNPVVLMWNHSLNTVVEGNTFIDSDRAIALGLIDQATGFDHQGGVARNNFVYQRPGLFSASRHAGSDGQIIVYDSPGTQVYHNTVMTSGNSVFSVEVRWANTGVVFSNNLADAPLHARDGGVFTGGANYLSATTGMFVNAANADLHLVVNAATQSNILNQATAVSGATADFDLQSRPFGAASDIGADEYAPPQVQGTTVNDGSAQRSRVTSLTVRFNAQVTFAGSVAQAFTLARSGGGAVAFTATASVVNGATVVTLSGFTGSETEFGSLKDGRYTLTALAAQINVGGAALDGDGDGVAGGNYVFGDQQGLFRFFGDINGDRHVDIADFGLFSATFNLSTGQTGFNTAFDFNNDGHIDIADFGQFSIRLFTVLP